MSRFGRLLNQQSPKVIPKENMNKGYSRMEHTSKYRGVYFSTTNNRWVVQLERHKHFPCFRSERDAAIYAEVHYRELYNESPNFPELSDNDLADEYSRVLLKRESDQAEDRSVSKQGLKKSKEKTSKYVGVHKKDNGTRWAARIQYRGKTIYAGSFSVNQENAEEQAARAYDKKALEMYGETAKLNFPLDKHIPTRNEVDSVE